MARETKQRQKELTLTSCQKILTPLTLFWFMANLELSRNQIRHILSVKLTFSLIVSFYFTKTESRTNTALTLLLWIKELFLPKNADICKLRRPCHQKVYFLKLNMCVYLLTKLQASSIILMSFRQGVILPPPLPQNKSLISPPIFFKQSDRLFCLINISRFGSF